MFFYSNFGLVFALISFFSFFFVIIGHFLYLFLLFPAIVHLYKHLISCNNFFDILFLLVFHHLSIFLHLFLNASFFRKWYSTAFSSEQFFFAFYNIFFVELIVTHILYSTKIKNFNERKLQQITLKFVLFKVSLNNHQIYHQNLSQFLVNSLWIINSFINLYFCKLHKHSSK